MTITDVDQILREINTRLILGGGMALLAFALFLNFFAKFPTKTASRG